MRVMLVKIRILSNAILKGVKISSHNYTLPCPAESHYKI